MSTITFGKYKGKLTSDIAILDPSYCSWVVHNLSDKFPAVVSELSTLIDPNSIYLNFGKYKNKTLAHIKEVDPEYITYLVNSDYVKNKRPDILSELQ